jgi:phosphoheptose isomerase
MTSNISDTFRKSVEIARETFASLRALEADAARAVELLAQCLTNGNKVLACGNGGSAADCADFCTELACRFVEDRQPYPALNLSQGGSLLTATANDYGFDEVFARQVRAFGRPNDLLIAISTSGRSANIRRALEQARESKLKSIALLGRDGGQCARIADVDLVVKGESTARIQEAHKFLLHVFCEICEPQLRK